MAVQGLEPRSPVREWLNLKHFLRIATRRGTVWGQILLCSGIAFEAQSGACQCPGEHTSWSSSLKSDPRDF